MFMRPLQLEHVSKRDSSLSRAHSLTEPPSCSLASWAISMVAVVSKHTNSAPHALQWAQKRRMGSVSLHAPGAPNSSSGELFPLALSSWHANRGWLSAVACVHNTGTRVVSWICGSWRLHKLREWWDEHTQGRGLESLPGGCDRRGGRGCNHTGQLLVSQRIRASLECWNRLGEDLLQQCIRCSRRIRNQQAIAPLGGTHHSVTRVELSHHACLSCRSWCAVPGYVSDVGVSSINSHASLETPICGDAAAPARCQQVISGSETGVDTTMCTF